MQHCWSTTMTQLFIKGLAQSIILLLMINVICRQLKAPTSTGKIIALGGFIMLFHVAGCFSVLDMVVLKLWGFIW